MRFLLAAFALSLLAAPAVALKPPRQESPAPLDVLAEVGLGNSDAELQRSIAAAAAHPLGTLANPVRVAGLEGAQAYVGRLRCSDGSAARVGSRRDGGVGAYGSIVHLFPVDCGAAAPGRIDLLVDIYHEENVETRAPAGFRLGN